MSAVVVSHVYGVKYVVGKVGTSGNLRKNRKEKVSAILFISIPEVEVIVHQYGPFSITQCYDILDHRGASR